MDQQNLLTFKNLLSEFVALKSISTDPQFKPEIDKTVKWLQNLFIKNDFQVEIIPLPTTNPVVLASYQVDPQVKTVLIYGHYDVQPANKANGWHQDPFTLLEKDNRLIARGIADNKGQILIHIFTVLQLIKEKKLKYNVKFLIEGNEETGSPEISAMIKQQQAKLSCDHVLASDGENPGRPMITATFRGITDFTLKVKTANKTVHSGLFGGPAPNAIHELSSIIAKLYDSKTNKSKIPELNENLLPITSEIQHHCEIYNQEKEALLKEVGFKKLLTEKGLGFLEQNAFRTSISVTGITGGYQGEGYSNIIAHQATAKVNIRVAPNQDPDQIKQAIIKYIKSVTPDYVELTFIEDMKSANPISINTSSSIHKQAIQYLEKAYNKDIMVEYCGAIVPVMLDFIEILHVQPVFVGLANDDCNMHGINENFQIDYIKKGLTFSKLFFS